MKSGGKTLLKNPSTNQQVSEKVVENSKKVGLNIWRICCKAVILHPLSRGKRDEVEMLETGDEVLTSTIEKKFSKKLEKVLVVQKNALPLHPLSERRP